MNRFLSVVALAGLACAANAQAPTAIYTWQVSDNAGVSWSDTVWVPAGQIINVRLFASWTGIPDAVGVGYAGGQFDARILCSGVVPISNIDRPVPFNFAPQTLVASAIAGGMKIDTSADVAGIGLGTGWVNPGQAAHFANPSAFNSTNGAVVFTYDVLSTSSYAIFDCVLNGTAGRSMAVYSNATGTQIRIDDSVTTVTGASIGIPTPTSFALLGIGGLTVARRRR